MPYLCGERTPWWNPDARGVFVGLNLASTKEEMYRAVLEGVAMSLAGIRDIFRETLDCGDTLRALGGGAQGETLLSIMADACGCRVETVEGVAEATSMGAAVTGGVACGLFADFTATERFVRTAGEVAPDAGRTAFYAKRRRLTEKAYHAMENIYAELAQETKGK